MDARKLKTASAVGVLVGLAGILAWYLSEWIYPICISMEPLPAGTCPSPDPSTGAWTVLFALVALVVLSSVVLVRSLRAS